MADVAELNALAIERGVTKSDLVREAITHLLEANRPTKKAQGWR